MPARLRCLLPPRLVIVAAAWLLADTTASAQQVVFAIRPPAGGATFGAVDFDAGTSRVLTEDDAQIGAVATSDGQLTVRSSGASQVVVRHVPTGTAFTLPLDFRPVLAHPRAAMLWGWTGISELARLDARGLVRFTPCAGTTTVAGFDIAPLGNVLAVACPGSDILIVDVESGAELRRLPWTALFFGFVAFTPDGAGVVATRTAASGLEVAVLDAQSGQVITSRAASPSWRTTGSRRHLLEFNCAVIPGSLCRYGLVDAATLTEVLPIFGSPFSEFSLSPDGRHAMVVEPGFIYSDAGVRRIHVPTGGVLEQVALGPGFGLDVDLRPAPMAPEALAATVSGGTVSLSWRLPADSPMATGYRLEAGTAPGATAVTFPLGSAEAFAVSGVPSGRYHVRVRALNVNGASGPSSDVVVDVP